MEFLRGSRFARPVLAGIVRRLCLNGVVVVAHDFSLSFLWSFEGPCSPFKVLFLVYPRASPQQSLAVELFIKRVHVVASCRAAVKRLLVSRTAGSHVRLLPQSSRAYSHLRPPHTAYHRQGHNVTSSLNLPIPRFNPLFAFLLLLRPRLVLSQHPYDWPFVALHRADRRLIGDWSFSSSLPLLPHPFGPHPPTARRLRPHIPLQGNIHLCLTLLNHLVAT